MENNQQQPKQPSFLESLAMIGGSALLSWGASKINPSAPKGWAPYRNQMTAAMAQTAFASMMDHWGSSLVPQQPAAPAADSSTVKVDGAAGGVTMPSGIDTPAK